jgi:hypothetical protein
MGSLPANVGVFFGKADKRSEGWYWADASKSEIWRSCEAAGMALRKGFT